MLKKISYCVFTLALSLTACVSHKELLYLNDLPPNINTVQNITNDADMQVQSEDLLSITVSSYNPDASKPFNPDVNSLASIAPALQGVNNIAELTSGYFVDKEGFIDFPNVGRVMVRQKTLNEVKVILDQKLKAFLKDPVISIRFLNLKVSVLGEVLKPGTIRLTNKRLTIFEAIGMAGDMTPFSNRSKVLLIREINGKRTIARINLQSGDIFQSPFYYLQQNDVVYVEPNKAKVNSISDITGKALSAFSVVISVLTLIVISRK